MLTGWRGRGLFFQYTTAGVEKEGITEKKEGELPLPRLSKNSPQKPGLSVKRGKKCEKGG